MTWRVINADCREAMAALVEASIDAIVTDPPYGLEFMGKEWDRLDGEGWRTGGGMSKPGIGERRIPWVSFGAGDTANATCATCGGRMRGAKKCGCAAPDWRVKGVPLGESGADTRGAQSRKMQSWHESWAREALRVLKPGAHLIAFGGTRTFHRLTCALEDAGFEIRDCLMWLYGSGFPKSLDVSKAIDKAAGAERPVIGSVRTNVGMQGGNFAAGSRTADVPITAAATEAARRWSGFGTALKPAWEPIILARKPLGERNVAANVQRHGTGSLNIDGCRIGSGEGGNRDGEASAERRYTERGGTNFAATPGPRGGAENGRWPANLVLDEAAAAMLDAQTGELTSGTAPDSGFVRNSDKHRNAYAPFAGNREEPTVLYGDAGGASRFFYTSKASTAERGEGNTHPTVKPIDLMQWLCRLVTPPGATVLDPFCGSGSTGIAALREGFDFIGVEQSEEYVAIARRRIVDDAPLLNAAGASA